MVDSIFCTVAGSCRIVAGQLPDSCRLFFTQLPPFWLEKGLILQNLLFSNQNDGNCVTNKRQLSGNWPATIRQLPATVQKIGSAKRGGPRIARLATLLRLARSHSMLPWTQTINAELIHNIGFRRSKAAGYRWAGANCRPFCVFRVARTQYPGHILGARSHLEPTPIMAQRRRSRVRVVGEVGGWRFRALPL